MAQLFTLQAVASAVVVAVSLAVEPVQPPEGNDDDDDDDDDDIVVAPPSSVLSIGSLLSLLGEV